MPAKGSGQGTYINQDGYVRISRRGPLRHQMGHRAYVDRQMQHSLGRLLLPTEEVHHQCKNRACWPPTDFHLCILDERIHHATEGVRTRFQQGKMQRARAEAKGRRKVKKPQRPPTSPSVEEFVATTPADRRMHITAVNKKKKYTKIAK